MDRAHRLGSALFETTFPGTDRELNAVLRPRFSGRFGPTRRELFPRLRSGCGLIRTASMHPSSILPIKSTGLTYASRQHHGDFALLPRNPRSQGPQCSRRLHPPGRAALGLWRDDGPIHCDIEGASPEAATHIRDYLANLHSELLVMQPQHEPASFDQLPIEAQRAIWHALQVADLEWSILKVEQLVAEQRARIGELKDINQSYVAGRVLMRLMDKSLELLVKHRDLIQRRLVKV